MEGLNCLTNELAPTCLFLYGRRPRRWQSFGRAVNSKPGAARGPDFVPAGHGTAHVFKTGCPSLRNRSAGELVVLHEADREGRVLIRRMIVQLLSSQAAASFIASGSDLSAAGSLPTSRRQVARSSPASCICSILRRVPTRILDVLRPFRYLA